jgi:hypothetical protein
MQSLQEADRRGAARGEGALGLRRLRVRAGAVREGGAPGPRRRALVTSPSPRGSEGSPTGLRVMLQDALARVLRAREAILDEEWVLAEQILDDLLVDIERVLGQ